MGFLFETSTVKPMKKWFAKNKVFGLILPEGWFGRPYDNNHRLTLLEERKNKLIVEVDEQLYFLLTKPLECSIVDGNLVISNFQQLTFDRQSYGDMQPYCKVYASGELTFVDLSR
jgi:hypothetical protein